MDGWLGELWSSQDMGFVQGYRRDRGEWIGIVGPAQTNGNREVRAPPPVED